MPPIADLAIHGGNIGLLLAVAWVLWKVNGRLTRDESLNRDYPPHRHINGSRIVYPAEYQPSPVERLGHAGD